MSIEGDDVVENAERAVEMSVTNDLFCSMHTVCFTLYIFEEFLKCVISAWNGVVNSVLADNWIVDFCVHYRPQGKVMFSQACVILLTIGLMATRSLLLFVNARSVCILLECFLVSSYGQEES